MQNLETELLRTALDWLSSGRRVVMGTVIRTWGSAPRPPGSLMMIRDDGQVVGSVSGGCIEDDLIARVARGELALRLPQLASYGDGAQQAAQRFGLPCGGTVQVLLEPLGPQSLLPELLAGVAAQKLLRRRLDLATGLVTLSKAAPGDGLAFDDRQLLTVHGPRLRLLLIGGGQLSRCLAEMAQMLDYQVTVCEPRTEYHEGWSGSTLSTAMPDDLVLAMQLDASSAVVALTHDPKLDDLALMEALRTPAFYVGAIGSLKNNAARRERLRSFGLGDAELARLRGPVGLNLRALTPPEIALSVVAELVALRRGADLAAPLLDWSQSQTACRT